MGAFLGTFTGADVGIIEFEFFTENVGFSSAVLNSYESSGPHFYPSEPSWCKSRCCMTLGSGPCVADWSARAVLTTFHRWRRFSEFDAGRVRWDRQPPDSEGSIS